MINGAGLAMATMDMIKLAGGEPANFLDIGGGASPERVLKAFRAVLQDDNVEVMLINIFAGINRCDWVAQGIVAAFKEIDVKIPVVVRLAGTHVEQGRRILRESGLPIITADTLAEAAEKAVAQARPQPEEDTRWPSWSTSDTRVLVQGITGRIGRFHTEEMIDYGTNVVGGVTPGQGGEARPGPAGLRHGQGGGRRDPGRRVDRLRAAAVRRRLDHGGGRRRHPVLRVHHRRHPDPGHDAGQALHAPLPARQNRMALTGPNCAGTITPGRVPAGHHARAHLPARPGRGHRPLRHARLRGGRPR